MSVFKKKLFEVCIYTRSNLSEQFTSVLNWCHKRNRDQKSSLQFLAAQKIHSPAFSAKVGIQNSCVNQSIIMLARRKSEQTADIPVLRESF